jgi:hypothetical protein
MASAQPTSLPPVQETGDFLFEAPGDIGSVSFSYNRGPAVWCVYSTNRKRPRLQTVVVEPPLVFTGPRSAQADLRAVRWHVQLETNTQDKLFEAEWASSVKSATQRVPVKDAAVDAFTTIALAVPAADSITIFRTALIVEWLDAEAREIATQLLLPRSYSALGGVAFGDAPGGCPAVF